jgi:hypothetical protein
MGQGPRHGAVSLDEGPQRLDRLLGWVQTVSGVNPFDHVGRRMVGQVTTAVDPSNLIRKLKERKSSWHDRIRAKLLVDGIISNRWSFRFLSFVRKNNLEKCQRSFSPADNVFFAAIEDATFSWEYWDKRLTRLP